MTLTTPSPTRLWNRDFGRWLLGIAGAALGDAVIYIALPFLVLTQGGDAATVATAVLFGSLPRFLGPLVGTLADRLPLRWPVSLAALGRGLAFAALGLAAVASPLPLALIYAAAFVNGTLALFVFAAGEVALPRLVPRAQLPRANSLLQGALLGLPLLGLAAGGALVGLLGAGGAILLATVGFAPLALLAPTIRFPSVTGSAREPVVRDLARGARFLLAGGPLLLIVAASLLLNAGLNLVNATVPVAMEARGFGAGGYGVFEGAVSAGVLLGLLLAGTLTGRLAPRWQLALGNLALALGFAALAAGFAVPDASLPLLAGCALPLGIGLGLTEVAAITLLQLAIPDGLRGKVLGSLFTVNALGLTLGAALAGRLEPLLGAPPLYAASAVAVLLVTLLWAALVGLRPAALDRLLAAAEASAAPPETPAAEPPAGAGATPRRAA